MLCFTLNAEGLLFGMNSDDGERRGRVACFEKDFLFSAPLEPEEKSFDVLACVESVDLKVDAGARVQSGFD